MSLWISNSNNFPILYQTVKYYINEIVTISSYKRLLSSLIDTSSFFIMRIASAEPQA